jgi:hypothetical protein
VPAFVATVVWVALHPTVPGIVLVAAVTGFYVWATRPAND